MSGWIVFLLVLSLVAPEFTHEKVDFLGNKRTWRLNTQYPIQVLAAILYVLETT